MDPKDYILSRLATLSAAEPAAGAGADLPEEICRLVLSKKFRKYAVTDEYKEHIRSAIRTCVAAGEPIKLTLVFGGYKLWRLEEAPEPDWAELFALLYYAQWLKPIAAIYAPGVWLDFFSDDVIVERMNNIPAEATKQYRDVFTGLLAFIKPYLPANLSFTYNRVGDQYADPADFTAELDALIEEHSSQLSIPLTPEQIEAIEMNVKLEPGQADDPLWREKVNLIHDAYTKVSKRRPYYRTADKIMVITRPIKDSLAVGTTKRSVVKFWIGAGVLLPDGDSFAETIYSPKQVAHATFTSADVDIAGLEGKNFKKIRIVQ